MIIVKYKYNLNFCVNAINRHIGIFSKHLFIPDYINQRKIIFFKK